MGVEWQRVGGLVAAMLIVLAPCWISPWRAEDVARAFMPGELGREVGRTQPEPSSRAYLTRAMYAASDVGGEEWSRENRLMPRLNFSHNLRSIFPPRLFDAHPEFFPLEDDVRLRPPENSYFWQPDIARKDVADYAADFARRYFDEHPEAESFAFGVNDGLRFGESPELLALVDRGHKEAQRGAKREAEDQPYRGGWFRERPDYSPLVFTFMNRVANDLAETHPDKLLGALAYYWCENAPPFPVRRQVVPFLTADRTQGYDPAFWQEEALLQRRWVRAKRGGQGPRTRDQGPRSKDQGLGTEEDEERRAESGGRRAEDGRRTAAPAARLAVNSEVESDNPRPTTNNQQPITNNQRPNRLGLYDYLYGSGFMVPRIHTRLLAENLRRARRAGFTDYYAESHSNWGLDGPMLWLAAQLLQDPEQSPEALLDEYYRRFFREAAVPMRRFFERCERQWMTQPGEAYWLKHYRNESQADLFPSAVCRELRGLLDDAMAGVAPSPSLRRTGKAISPNEAGDPVAMRRVKFVSDAFGVTERLVAMQEARTALCRCVLRGDSGWRRMAGLLKTFAAAHDEFVNFTRALHEREPLAVANVLLDDFTQDDPAPGALLAIARKAAAAGELDRAKAEVASDDAARAMMESATEDGLELLHDGSLEGTLRPPKVVAGQAFEAALPAAWLSSVEPCEHFEVERLDGSPPVLRLRGNKDTQIYQWAVARPGECHVVRLEIRGKVSSSCVAKVMIGWLSADNQHLGLQVARLPEGEWPDWVELELAGTPPPDAKWAGFGLRVNNQMGDDWIEVRDFGMEAR